MNIIEKIPVPLIDIVESYVIFKPTSRSELDEAIELWFEK